MIDDLIKKFSFYEELCDEIFDDDLLVAEAQKGAGAAIRAAVPKRTILRPTVAPKPLPHPPGYTPRPTLGPPMSRTMGTGKLPPMPKVPGGTTLPTGTPVAKPIRRVKPKSLKTKPTKQIKRAPLPHQDPVINAQNFEKALTVDKAGNVVFKNPKLQSKWYENGKLKIDKSTANKIANKLKKDTHIKQVRHLKEIAKIQQTNLDVLNTGSFRFATKEFLKSPKGIAAGLTMAGVAALFMIFTGNTPSASTEVGKDFSKNAEDMAENLSNQINDEIILTTIDAVKEDFKGNKDPALKEFKKSVINLKFAVKNLNTSLVIDNPTSISMYMSKLSNLQNQAAGCKSLLEKLDPTYKVDSINQLNTLLINTINIIEGIKKSRAERSYNEK